MVRTSPLANAPADAGFWEQDLGYLHAFVTVMMALSLGLAFHAWVGYRWLGYVPPLLLAGLALLPLLGMAGLARSLPNHRLVTWFTGVPFAMVTSATFGMLALGGGVVPQSWFTQRLGVESIWGSWPFLMVGYLMMVNLVGSCGRRIWPLSYRNVVYLSSHLGLAIALIGGVVSSLMLERRTMVLFRGMPTQVATDRQLKESAAPFTAQLREFRMDTFPPTLTLATLDTAAPEGVRQTPGSALIKLGTRETLGQARIEVTKYLPKGAFDGLHWHAVGWPDAAPAAFVKASRPDGSSYEGWVSSGSAQSAPAMLRMGESQAILMNTPRPRKFESDLLLDGRPVTVGVNQPARVKGYDVYQFSYDQESGAASPYSVIEIVRDPGLPVVYSGIFLLLFGSALHLWNGFGVKA